MITHNIDSNAFNSSTQRTCILFLPRISICSPSLYFNGVCDSQMSCACVRVAVIGEKYIYLWTNNNCSHTHTQHTHKWQPNDTYKFHSIEFYTFRFCRFAWMHSSLPSSVCIDSIIKWFFTWLHRQMPDIVAQKSFSTFA